MRINKREKKFVAWICVIAMIFAGMTQFPSKASADDSWQDAVIAEDNETITDLGKWSYCFKASNGSQAQIRGGDEYNNFGFKAISSKKAWAGMTAYATFDTKPDQEYEFTLKLNATGNGAESLGSVGLYYMQYYRYEYDMDGEHVVEEGYNYGRINGINPNINLVEGDNGEFKGTFTAKQEQTRIVLFVNEVAPGVEINITDISIKEPNPIPGPPEEIPEGWSLVPSNIAEWSPVGSTNAWEIYAGAWNADEYAYIATKNDEENPYKLSVNYLKTTKNNYYLAQLRVTFDDLDIGERYLVEVKEGDKVISRKVFLSNNTSYRTDNIGIGDGEEGSIVEYTATCEVYKPDTSLLPNNMEFEDAISSKYNALLDASYVQSSTHEENTDGVLTDGNLLTGYLCTGRELTNQDVVVTLKKEQDVSKIQCGAIDFKDTLTVASPYKIEISPDGENYEEIGSYTADTSDEFTFKAVVLPVDTSKVTFEKFKYVRLTLDGGNAYGYQIREFGLILSEKRQEETTTPKPTKPVETSPQTSTTPQTPTGDSGTKVDETTTKLLEPINTEPQVTTKGTVEQPTTEPKVDSSNQKVAKASVKSATKSKASKKANIKLKKLKGVAGYQIQFSKTKKFKKVLFKKNVKKNNAKVTSKKIKNIKTLYVRARAYKNLNGKKNYGDWSKVKKVKIK